jgi:hypothetical protein
MQVRSAMCLSAVAGLGTIADASPETVTAGLLDLGPSVTFLPGAGRLHVKDGCAFHVPSQQAAAQFYRRSDQQG